MHLKTIVSLTGLLLTLFSLVLLVPIGVALFYEEPAVSKFLLAFAITLGTGLVLWLPFRPIRDLRNRDGFIVVSLFYFALGAFGAVPFFSLGVANSWSSAVFESVSGLTTTGATMIAGLDELPKSLLIYRQLLQWLGGMGIVVLAVAVLPMLGIGGMQLSRSELTGPDKGSKLAPRITETARALWLVYLGLTIACGLAYYLAGMTPFDAISHAFSTVAIGGFSTHDASIGYFNSYAINWVAIGFMTISGLSFALHFRLFREIKLKVSGRIERLPGRGGVRSWLPYLASSEARAYLLLLLTLSLIVSIGLSAYGVSDRVILDAVFQVVSTATTSGFATTDFSLWPSFLPILLLLSAFVGGCAGSTAGGLKVVRVLLVYRQGVHEIKRLIHPTGVFPVKLDDTPVPSDDMQAVWGFFALYGLTFVVMLLLILMVGNLDFLSAFSAVAACLNNLGPGLGEVASNYSKVSAAGQWLLSITMILGRLEIFTLLVLLTPTFWRR